MKVRDRAVNACAKFIDDVLTAYGRLDEAKEVDIISNTTTLLDDPLPIDSVTEIAFGFRSTHGKPADNSITDRTED